MKFLSTLFLALFLLVSNAHSDYKPGRIRAAAIGQMRIHHATGDFANARSVVLTENHQDGRGLISYNLNVDGADYFFLVKLYKPSNCGNRAEAAIVPFDKTELHGAMQVVDMLGATCTVSVKFEWNVEVSFYNTKTKTKSTMLLEANPERFVVTQELDFFN